MTTRGKAFSEMDMEKMKKEYPDKSTEISVAHTASDLNFAHTPLHSFATAEDERTETVEGECAPLISVIVPIYNVEKYVRKCLDSLRGQTMKQIEVICIDDGSTDSSGKIADEYSTDPGVWPIFRVIHTSNRGLSAARNRGIDEARSEWIMFVDSDDWVEPGFCEIPYEAAIENKADLVIFRAYQIENGKACKDNASGIPRGKIDFFTAIEYDGCAPWRRLYRRYLFENVRFPEGRLFEDIATTHKVVHLAEQIYMLTECLYYHLNRKDSITGVHSKIRHRDSLISNIERYEDLTSWGYPAEKLESRLCSAALGYLAYFNYHDDASLYSKAEEIVEKTKGLNKSYPLWKKVAFETWKRDRRLFTLLSRKKSRRR